MRRRLTVGPDGTLIDNDGNAHGRLLSLTVETPAEGEGGIIGGVEVSSQAATSAVEGSDSQEQLEISADEIEKTNPHGGVGEKVARIWAKYQRTIPGASRAKLDSTAVTIIRNALKVRTEPQCSEAIDGLAHSPFHNGENDRHKKYLGIRYALKGNQREGEKPEERIDKMIEVAQSAVSDPLGFIPSDARGTVRDRQRLVEDMLKNPGDENRRARAGDSLTWLEETWGLTPQVSAVDFSTGQSQVTITWERVES